MTTLSFSNPPRVRSRQWSLGLGHLLVILIWSLVIPTSAAANPWTLTTADFKSETVTLDSIAADAIIVSSEAQPQRRVALNEFLMLSRAGGAMPSAARFAVVLQGDDRALGEPKAIRGDNLIWQNPLMGELSLPLKSVQSIALAGQTDAQAGAAGSRTEDVVTMANGDTVRGIISDIDAEAVSIQPPGGAATRVPLEAIRKIAFAVIGTPAAATAPQRGFSIRLSDRTTLTAANVKLTDSALAITLADGASRTLPLNAVQSIEQIHGPVTWLSSLEPTSSVNRPYFALSWPARMNRAVDGEPLRVGEEVYARGIGVHAYSELSWAIDPKWKAFRTQYAIAGDWPYANVTVRIKLDDKVVHEQADVRSGPLSPPVVVPIQGQKKLTLEVDYGQNYDVQDRLNWIEPALLNFVPSSAN